MQQEEIVGLFGKYNLKQYYTCVCKIMSTMQNMILEKKTRHKCTLYLGICFCSFDFKIFQMIHLFFLGWKNFI